MLPAPAEDPEYERHLESIREDCEDSAADSSIAYPECRRSVPQHESTVMPGPESTDSPFPGDAFRFKQGNEGEKDQDPASRNEERDREHYHAQKTEQEDVAVSFILG